MGKNEQVSVEQQVIDLQEQIETELEAIKKKYREKEQALISKLRSEIADLKASLKSKEKSLEKLTGKPTVSVSGVGRATRESGPTNLILSVLASDETLAQSEVVNRVMAKYPEANRLSITQTTSEGAKKGKLWEKATTANGGEGVKITEAGKAKLAGK